MDIIRNNRFIEDYVVECAVWKGGSVGSFEEGHIYNGIPDLSILFVFKEGMKLSVGCSCGWKDVARGRCWMIMGDT